MNWRFSLLSMTAAAAGLSAVANAVAGPAEPQTRMGASIGRDLAQKDRAAAQRNRSLDMREQAARAAEQRLKAAAAAAPQPKREQPAEPVEENDRYGELARIYQAMKPKAAAPVFEQLGLDLQVEVARRMRERSTAAIMAAMTAPGAAKLSTAMARQGTDRPGWMAAGEPSPAPARPR